MCARLRVVNVMSSDAYWLALENERRDRAASGNLNVLDFVNKPDANGVCRVFGLRLPEEGGSFVLPDLRPLLNDRPDAFLVRHYRT